MLDTDSLTDGLRRLSIGRIIYCVVAAAPIAISFILLLNPRVTHEDELGSGMLLLLMLLLDIPVVFVGIAVLIWKKIKREPLLFWSAAVFVSSIPLISLIAMIGFGDLSKFKIPA